MEGPPGGTVTFLFSDIEGSTNLLRELGARYEGALEQHRTLLRSAFAAHAGFEVGTEGDSFLVAFYRATEALAAALQGQRALAAQEWPDDKRLKVRIGIHTGEVIRSGDGYVGMAVHRGARIGAAGHGGQVLVSETTRQLVAEDLPPDTSLRELGEYRLKDLTHPQRLYQLVHPDLEPEFPRLRTLDHTPNNLPQQLTSFVGRRAEMGDVTTLLGTARLLTLTGAGGSGKSRLAIQIAADRSEEYRDGVWLVELAPLAEPAHVPHAVATVLGILEEPGRPILQTISDALRSRRMLLVLDNCEHVVGACADLAESLLRVCPDLVVLATSREALGLAGETTWRVPSFITPDARGSLEAFSQFDAVRLFIDRALLVQPEFTVTNANAPAVAEICNRLDGMPLAIELAAARVKLLAPEQINERLADRFRLLTSGARNVAPRQKTLRALVDWSFDLLAEPERALLSRLSVFAGGFELETAERVCSGGEIARDEVLDILSQLVEKSLVQAEDRDGRSRYRLLETIREYANEKLADAETWRDRHLAWIAALAEEAEEATRGHEQKVWLGRLEAEHDNIRGALRWSLTKGDPASVCQIGAALRRFWFVRGHMSEGRSWLEEALAHTDALAPADRARGLWGAGVMTEMQGDIVGARRYYEAQLVIAREIGSSRDIVGGLHELGNMALTQGDFDRAEAAYAEVVRVAGESGDVRGSAYALGGLGLVRRLQGDHERARPMMEEALVQMRELGDTRNIAVTLIDLGEIERSAGDRSGARALLDEALAMAREIDDAEMIVLVLVSLGSLSLDEDDVAQGQAHFVQALELERRSGARRDVALYLEGLARAAIARGDGLRASRLLGAAEMSRERTGVALYPVDRPIHDSVVETARTLTGPEGFASAWATGRALSWQEAVAEALATG